MFVNKYPYTDFHEINLDWILAEIMKLHHDYDEFKAVNTITNAGAWDITKQYQAWTIVSDNNIGYISLKPVPAGVAITNTEYWGVIADYDILITDLSNRISALEGQMSTLTGTTIPAINSNISNIQGELNLINNKKIIFIADSYAGTSDFVTKVNSIMGWTAGVDSFCNAVGGEGFIEGTGGNGFLDELQQHAGSMTSAVRNSITDIMVIGGANDAKTNQIYGANPMENNFVNFVNYAVANFPNAKIHVGFIGVCKFSSSTLENRTQNNLEICAYHYRDMALKYGCAYMTYVEYTTRWMAGLSLNADGLHPNTNGGTIIANAIINYIKNHGITTSISRYDCPCSSVFGGNDLKMVFSMNNNIASIELGRVWATGFTGTIAGGNWDSQTRTHIADYQNIFVNRDLHALAFVFVNSESDKVQPIDLRFQGTEITAVAMKADASGWKDITLTNAFFVITPTCITFDPIIMA